MKVIEEAETTVDPLSAVAIIIICGVLSLFLSGCGYGFVYIQPDESGDRITLSKESRKRVDSVYETAIDIAESQVDPVSAVRRLRQR